MTKHHFPAESEKLLKTLCGEMHTGNPFVIEPEEDGIETLGRKLLRHQGPNAEVQERHRDADDTTGQGRHQRYLRLRLEVYAFGEAGALHKCQGTYNHTERGHAGQGNEFLTSEEVGDVG